MGMIWDFSEGTIFRTVYSIYKYSEQTPEAIVQRLVSEWDGIERCEADPFDAYMDLHRKIGIYIRGSQADAGKKDLVESAFVKSAQQRVKSAGPGILLKLEYAGLDTRLVVSKQHLFVLVPHELDAKQDAEQPQQLASKIAGLLEGECYYVKKVSDISWYTKRSEEKK